MVLLIYRVERQELGFQGIETMKMLDSTPTLFSPEKADSIAAEMNADDDWTWRAIHDPKGTGYSLVAAYDEAGVEVAKL